LIETIAAEARRFFRRKEKSAPDFFEAMLLGIRKHAVREGFRVRCRERRHVQRAKLSVKRTRGALFVVMWRSLPPISIIFFSSSLTNSAIGHLQS